MNRACLGYAACTVCTLALAVVVVCHLCPSPASRPPSTGRNSPAGAPPSPGEAQPYSTPIGQDQDLGSAVRSAESPGTDEPGAQKEYVGLIHEGDPIPSHARADERQAASELIRQLCAGRSSAEAIDLALRQLAALQTGPATPSHGAQRLAWEHFIVDASENDPLAFGALLDAARGSPPPGRELATWLIGRLPTQVALAFLSEELLRSPLPDLRIAAVEALGQDQGRNVKADLEPNDVRTHPFPGPIRSRAIVEALIALLRREQDQSVSHMLLNVLADSLREQVDTPKKTGEAHDQADAPAPNSETVLAAFCEVIGSSGNTRLRAHALSGLDRSNSPEAARIISEAARNAPTSDERVAALFSLGALQWWDPNRVDIIVGAMQDSDLRVQSAAVQSAPAAGRDEATLQALLVLSRSSKTTDMIGAQTLTSAMANLLSIRDRFGAPATPEFSRALCLFEDWLAHSRKDRPPPAAAFSMLRTIESAIEVGYFHATEDESSRIVRLLDLAPKH